MSRGLDVLALLGAHAGEHPGRPAFISRGEQLTYLQLYQDVVHHAGQLQAAGLAEAATIGMTVKDDWLHLKLTLAAMVLGVPTVNIPAYRPDEQRESMAEACRVSHQIIDAGVSKLPACHAVTVDDLLQAKPYGALQPRPLEGAAVYIATSGSTGAPKIIARSADQMSSGIDQTRAGFAKRDVSGERPVCILRGSGVEHDTNRINRLYQTLSGGVSAFWDLPLAHDDLPGFCRASGVSLIHLGIYGLGQMLKAIPEQPERGFFLPADTKLLIGGGAVSAELRQKAMARLCPDVRVIYATSEVGLISVALPHHHALHPDCLGAPGAGVQISLRDESGIEVAKGESGFCHIYAPQLALRYQTGQSCRDADGWFNTRDLIRHGPEGTLVYHGRADERMILNGINIFPEAIEQALGRHPSVADVIAYARPSQVHGEIPCAAVVLMPGDVTQEAELLRYARQSLGLLAPRKIDIVERLPRTETGKPLRRLL